nr:CTD small phosphatase-like protein 2 isoform X1 [Tanacetum cinerariifolium]
MDIKKNTIRSIIFSYTKFSLEGNDLKDLSVVGRDLAHVVMINNSRQAFRFQVDNGVPIKSWFDDRSDQALLSTILINGSKFMRKLSLQSKVSICTFFVCVEANGREQQNANPLPPDTDSSAHQQAVLNRVHPPQPDWYEEFYAGAMDKTVITYEAEVVNQDELQLQILK